MGPCFVLYMYFSVSILVWQTFFEEDRAGCFALIVSLLSCGCQCSMSFSRGAVGWFVVCNCGISWSKKKKKKKAPAIVAKTARDQIGHRISSCANQFNLKTHKINCNSSPCT